ncbi:MAG: hypothetical protein DME96_14850, partial [Verrucomicrobia bacterium]
MTFEIFVVINFFRWNALITQRSENLRKAGKLSTIAIAIQEAFIMNVLVVDVGGSNVKILATGQTEPRKFPSGPTLTARQMVNRVKKLAGNWKYDVVS